MLLATISPTNSVLVSAGSLLIAGLIYGLVLAFKKKFPSTAPAAPTRSAGKDLMIAIVLVVIAFSALWYFQH